MEPYPDTHYRNFSSVNTISLFPKLSEDRIADVTIIGGGLAGMSTAYSLTKPAGLLLTQETKETGNSNVQSDKKLSVCVVEANKIGYGASGRNGGFAMPGFALTERELVSKIGLEKAKPFLELSMAALQLVKKRVIEFGGKKNMSEGMVWANWFDTIGEMKSNMEFMKSMYPSVNYKYMSKEEVRSLFKSKQYYDGFYDPVSFQYHSLDYCKEMAVRASKANVSIYEDTVVKEIRAENNRYKVITTSGTIDTKHVVWAVSGYKSKTPIKGVPFILKSSVVPIETWVMSTKPMGKKLDDAISAKFGLIDTRFNFDYYRPIPNTNGELLWGGRCAAFPVPLSIVKNWLTKDLLNIYPQLKGFEVASVWSGTMGYTYDRMPLLGQIAGMPGFWFNTGHGGHGIVTTTLAGELLARAIDSNDQRYKMFELFPPKFCFGNLGRIGGQGIISWAEFKDMLREWREKK